MINKAESLLERVYKKRIWDDKPVFCFTSDIDWASEDVMDEYFKIVNDLEINPTLFLTHKSDIIQSNFEDKKIERGIHPNFLPGSSHGNNFREVIETCINFAPEAYGYRSHRAFDVTDTSHLLKNEFNYKYVSHHITVFQPYIRPYLHESGLICLPVFFEDGTHLYNKLNLDILEYKNFLVSPGLKIISFHPMNFVFNSPSITYMRQIKDSLSREEYNNISHKIIEQLRNKNHGIQNTVIDIIRFVKTNSFRIMSLNEIYNTTLK